MRSRSVVIVSNRGPVSFEIDEHGGFKAKRGAGGLVSGIAPLVSGSEDSMWIAAALSPGDRAAAAEGIHDAQGFRVRFADHDPTDFKLAYDVICNATLWFVHHGLYELARRPRIDRRWFKAWDAYRRYNQVFADTIVEAAPEEAAVLVQDYHLSLVAPMIAERRPDLALVHFSHTPFATPEQLMAIPDEPRRELMTSLAAFRACGFHTDRWRNDFVASSSATIGSAPDTIVSPLGPDAADLEAVASSQRCTDARVRLQERVGERRLILRVDRIELSKNLLRGFWAFDTLLDEHPEWRGEVVFAALVYPSREGLPEYLAYRRETEQLVELINAKWATDDWTPVILDDSDDFATSVAALRSYDVLLVNPIRDGLNLVAKEGPLVNENDGVVVLSTEAGAWEELNAVAIGVNPYDLCATADAMVEALELSPSDRSARAKRLASAAASRRPVDWMNDLVAASD